MTHYCATLAYDGTFFLGWQNSIEAVVQRALETIVQHPIYLQAASRTDRGVHAHGQVINFATDKEVPFVSLNRLLPPEIKVLSLERCPSTFHPTVDVVGKEYLYYVCQGVYQLPIHRHYSWHVPHQLNLLAMQEGSAYLEGVHDFASFSNQSLDQRETTKEIFSIKIDELPSNRLSFSVAGNHFLYKMVRNLVGTLVDVGRRRIEPSDLPAILAARLRPKSGVTAPAHGLFLNQVFYNGMSS